MINYQQFYWNKLESGELWLEFCSHCRKFIFYPRERCPHCQQLGLQWIQSPGTGTLYSYTIVHVSPLPEFQDKTPYIYALVELDEGVRLATNLIDCPLDKVQIGMPLKLVCTKRAGRNLPVFKPQGS